MLGPFIDTIIVCAMTALVILVTDVRSSGLSSSSLTAKAFDVGLFGYGQYIVGFGLIFFAYSTTTPPDDWQVKPTQRSFVLAPGETFTEPLTLTPPPRQIARTHALDVLLILYTPETAELHLPASLTVGLRDIHLGATAYWNGDNLILRQSLRNLSDETVSFNAYCDPPGRARQERFFRNVAPGESAFQTYVLPDARYLAGRRIPLGIDEIEGPRNLNQFAEVPQ